MSKPNSSYPQTHPAWKAVLPTREPDFKEWNCSQRQFWFDEMIVRRKNSAGQYEEAALLATCPATGMLIYMERYWPICWNLIEVEGANEAYQAYVNDTIEKTVLCDG